VKILSLDLSSASACLALLENHRLETEIRWEQTQKNGQHLFSEWHGLIARHGLLPEDIGLYACGRGPGSFSGMRIAITAIRLAALPRQTPTFFVSSGEAIAEDTAKEVESEDVVVVGDARRGMRWSGRFRRSGSGVRQNDAWSLKTPEAWLRDVPPGAVIASPDWTVLQETLTTEERRRFHWLPYNCYPSAASIARIALERMAAGTPSEAADPLYLHEAVRQRPSG
jgi:tRNA threonylcarbamoyladenosine biosynthesis protein TsaB